jgi:hypothetical protein
MSSFFFLSFFGSCQTTSDINIKQHKQKSKSKESCNDLPRELMGETGVLKKRTEVTMTTTRLTQLPTECVTGDTFDSIIYDTYFDIFKL